MFIMASPSTIGLVWVLQTTLIMAGTDNPEAVSGAQPAFTFTKIAAGFPGAEGPVFSQNGAFYLVTPGNEVDGKAAGQIVKVDVSTGQSEVVCSPRDGDYGGIPAGCQFDRDGNLWVADMRLGILKVNVQDGSFKQVAKTDSAGDIMQGCNDCSLDYHGNLWVTAPAGQIAPHPYRRSTDEAFGAVYCMTAAGEVVKIDSKYLFPNGIAVQHSPEGVPQVLLVAETGTKSLWAYNITGPGQVSKKTLWGKLPGEHAGGPDGMDFDSSGHLLVANWGSGFIEVFPPTGGKPVRRIKCPFQAPSNIHFKPGTAEVYVTEHTYNALWRFTWDNTGRTEASERAY